MENCLEFKNILDNLHEGVYCVDSNRRIVFWNKGAERITGYSASDVMGHPCSDNILVHIDGLGSSLCRANCPLNSVIQSGINHSEDNIYLHHREGHRVPVSVSVSAIRDGDGEIIGAIELFRDNAKQAYDPEYVEHLKRAALLDPLTDLPNRKYVEMKLVSSFEEMKRHGMTFGVLFMDIDHFKAVNDNHGHAVGDRVLKMVSRTLEGNMRSYNIVGRWGGEEFVCVLNHLGLEQLQLVGRRLCSLVGNSFLETGGRKVSVTMTIGATMARDEDSIQSILERADSYLYKGKAMGRDCIILEGQKI